MKKSFLTNLILLIAFTATSQSYQYISSNRNFATGTYYISGWGNVTLTVPAGQEVTFIFNGSAYGSGPLVVNGKLTTSNALQTGGAVTVGSDASLTINGTFTPGPGSNLATGSVTSTKGLSLNNSIIVAGQFNVDGNASLNSGGLTINSTGTVNVKNITFNGINTLEGGLTVSGNMTINGGTNNMACPGSIKTGNLINHNTNTIAGIGFITVTGTFTSGNNLTSSENITLNCTDAGNGSNAQKKPGKATLSSTSSCAPATLNPAATLPVVFGPINARISNNILAVTWSTLCETNNNYFDIEVSADGASFHKIGDPIISKAENGNSDSVLSYNLSRSISASAFAATTFALLLLIPGFSKRKKLNRWMTGGLVVLLASTLYSCSKQDAVSLPEQSNVFVRIAQVDKDGTVKYSPVIKAIQ